MRSFEPKKILEYAGRVRRLAKNLAGQDPATRVFDPQQIADQARKVRALARLFDAACEYSLAADTFEAAAELYTAARLDDAATECQAAADRNAVDAMDRILRIAADGLEVK